MAKLIAELGLRYRPTSQTDLDAHAALLLLLASDLADLPAEYLERAIRRWVTKSPFLPKASDLVTLARDELSSSSARSLDPAPGPHSETLAARGNRQMMMTDQHRRSDIMWIDDGAGGARLVLRD